MLSQNFSPASSRSGTPVSIPSSKISSPARSRTSSAHVNLEMLSTHGSPRHQRVRQLSGQTELMHSPMHSPQPIRYLEDSLSVAVPAGTLNRRLENFLAEQELKRKHSPEVPSPLRAEPNKRSRGESKPNLIQKKEIIANIRQHLAKLHNKGSIAVTQPANDFQKAHQQQVTLLQQQFPASFNNHNWKHGDQLNDNINQLLTDFTFNLSDSDSRYTAAAFGTKSPLKHYLSYHSRPGFESAGLEPLLIELSFYFCHLAALPSDQREPFLIDFPNTAFPVNEILDDNDFNLVTETCVPGTYNRLSEATYKLRCLIIPGFKDNNYYSAAQDFIQKQIASLDLIEKLSNHAS